LSKYFTFEISVSVLLSLCSLSVPAQVILGESVSRAALAHVVQGLAGASAAQQQQARGGSPDAELLACPARPTSPRAMLLPQKKKEQRYLL